MYDKYVPIFYLLEDIYDKYVLLISFRGIRYVMNMYLPIYTFRSIRYA